MRRTIHQALEQARLLLLSLALLLCAVPTAQAIRCSTSDPWFGSPSSTPSQPGACYGVETPYGDVRIGLFVGNNPISQVDPLGLARLYQSSANNVPSIISQGFPGPLPYLAPNDIIEAPGAFIYNAASFAGNSVIGFGEGFNAAADSLMGPGGGEFLAIYFGMNPAALMERPACLRPTMVTPAGTTLPTGTGKFMSVYDAELGALYVNPSLGPTLHYLTLGEFEIIPTLQNAKRFVGGFSTFEDGVFLKFERQSADFQGTPFVGNNPVSFIDPIGLATVVAIGQPTSSNPFGHAAIATTGEGVVSFGTGTMFGSSFTDYLNKQATYRSTILYFLNTTPAQEQAINEYLKTQKGRPIDLYPDNCAQRTSSALIAAGIQLMQTVQAAPTAGIPMETTIDGSIPSAISDALAKQNVLQIYIPHGTTLPPKFLTGFNPKK